MKLVFISKHPGIYSAVLKAVRTCYRNVLCSKLIKRMNLRLASPADHPTYDTKRPMPCHLKIQQKLRKSSFNQSIRDVCVFKLAKDLVLFRFPCCAQCYSWKHCFKSSIPAENSWMQNSVNSQEICNCSSCIASGFNSFLRSVQIEMFGCELVLIREKPSQIESGR